MIAVILLDLAAIGLSMALCLYRAAIGPTNFDRIVAFDCFTFDVMGAMALVSLRLKTQVYLDVILVVALLGFVSTIAFAIYLGGSLLD